MKKVWFVAFFGTVGVSAYGMQLVEIAYGSRIEQIKKVEQRKKAENEKKKHPMSVSVKKEVLNPLTRDDTTKEEKSEHLSDTSQ